MRIDGCCLTFGEVYIKRSERFLVWVVHQMNTHTHHHCNNIPSIYIYFIIYFFHYLATNRSFHLANNMRLNICHLNECEIQRLLLSAATLDRNEDGIPHTRKIDCPTSLITQYERNYRCFCFLVTHLKSHFLVLLNVKRFAVNVNKILPIFLFNRTAI